MKKSQTKVYKSIERFSKSKTRAVLENFKNLFTEKSKSLFKNDIPELGNVFFRIYLVNKFYKKLKNLVTPKYISNLEEKHFYAINDKSYNPRMNFERTNRTRELFTLKLEERYKEICLTKQKKLIHKTKRILFGKFNFLN